MSGYSQKSAGNIQSKGKLALNNLIKVRDYTFMETVETHGVIVTKTVQMTFPNGWEAVSRQRNLQRKTRSRASTFWEKTTL